jgi:hypothetical protein
MDSRSRLDEAPTRASNSSGTDWEERLLRFVDRLRTEQVRAFIMVNARPLFSRATLSAGLFQSG